MRLYGPQRETCKLAPSGGAWVTSSVSVSE